MRWAARAEQTGFELLVSSDHYFPWLDSMGHAPNAWVTLGAVAQATENYRLVQLRLREGAATPTEIADAQASLTRAQQNYLNARYSYLIAMDRLDYAMGVGRTPNMQAPGPH